LRQRRGESRARDDQNQDVQLAHFTLLCFEIEFRDIVGATSSPPTKYVGEAPTSDGVSFRLGSTQSAVHDTELFRLRSIVCTLMIGALAL